jgi:ATP-binding cassette subfamily C (CFTR/MRP) protein 4
MEFKSAIIIGLIIITGIFGSAISHHLYFFNILNYGIRIKTSCIGLCYRKSLKLRTGILNTKLNGKIVNLITNDAQHIEEMVFFLPYFIISPLQTIFVIHILIQNVDKSFLSGLFILLSLIPIQIISGKLFSNFKNKAVKETDSRISLISEIVESIKIIKMYGWENSFKTIINKIRKREMKYYAAIDTIYALNSSMENDFTSIITYLSVSFLIMFTEIPLKAKFIVFAIGLYSRLCNNLGYFLSRAIILLISGLISIKRIHNFLLESEYESTNFSQSDISSINIDNLNACWHNEDSNEFKLKNISLSVKQNELVGVIGRVGSGKSSLLMAILNEMDKHEGKIDIKGTVSFVSQEPWIFPSSIKQNILFGKKYDKERFKLVLKLSCLDKDIKTMSHKENTLVGEKGISLSGGQRARVSLARALYSDSQIYLFDDPLSAVDANVAKNLFDNCINGYLKNKIRILVTHQVQHVIKANQILILDNGKVKAKGSYQEIIESNIDINGFLLASDSTKRKKEKKISETNETDGSFAINQTNQSNYLNGSSLGLELNSSKLNIEVIHFYLYQI